MPGSIGGCCEFLLFFWAFSLSLSLAVLICFFVELFPGMSRDFYFVSLVIFWIIKTLSATVGTSAHACGSRLCSARNRFSPQSAAPPSVEVDADCNLESEQIRWSGLHRSTASFIKILLPTATKSTFDFRKKQTKKKTTKLMYRSKWRICMNFICLWLMDLELLSI